jgi:TonB-dependent receptor
VTEVKEVTQDRHAVTGAAGWRAADGLTIKADALWSEYQITENQFQAWYGNNITGNYVNVPPGPGGNANLYNNPGSSYRVVDGSVVAATLNGAFPNYESSINRYDEKHTLIATGVNAEWDVGDWDHQVDLSYSDAWRKNRWVAIYLSDQYPTNPSYLTYNVTDGQTPYAALGFNPADPALQTAGGFRSSIGSNVSGTGQSDGPEETRDKLMALAFNTTRTLDNAFLTDVKFGGRVSDREKTHHSNRWGLCAGTGSTTFPDPNDLNTQVCPAGTHTISLANAGLSSFSAPGFTAPPMVYGNFDALLPLVYPNTATPAGSEMLLVHTKVTERSLEGFLKIDFKASILGFPLKGNLGARVANVQTESTGFSTIDGKHFTPVSVSNSYTDVLPSLNTALHLPGEQLLRFAASVGIARPPLDALVTGFSLNPTGNPPSGGGGNPLLKPYKADQFDLSYEWYFHDESLFALATYYKKLETTIAAGQSLQTIGPVQYRVTDEHNKSGGDIVGAELTVQTRFYFLPGVLRDFGVYANHAYVTSNVHESAPASNPYPMIGLARGTSELDLFYNKLGFETRVALKHHTAFTVAPTWVGTTLKQLAPETTLDASVSYEWGRQWVFRLQGHNLTNERARFTTDNNPQNLANDGGYQVYGRSYLFDVGFRF